MRFLQLLFSQAKLALVSSAGFVTPDQPHFDESFKGGDPSFREISSMADVKTLVETHRSESFDHAGLERDPNVGFPIDRVRELAAAGRIGSVRSSRSAFFDGLVKNPSAALRCNFVVAAHLKVRLTLQFWRA